MLMLTPVWGFSYLNTFMNKNKVNIATMLVNFCISFVTGLAVTAAEIIVKK